MTGEFNHCYYISPFKQKSPAIYFVLIEKDRFSRTEPHAVDSEETLSGDEDCEESESDSASSGSTWPYVTESREDVYRVGWSAEVVPDVTLSDSEDEVETGGSLELWTHVHHPDHEPAPYTESRSSQEEILIDSEIDETQAPPTPPTPVRTNNRSLSLA